MWPVYIAMYRQLFAVRCDEVVLADVIGWVHFGVLLIAIPVLTVLKLMYKTSGTVRVWRVLAFGSLVAMVLCYVLAVFGRVHEGRIGENLCTFKRFMLAVYARHGWIEILPPLLLMIFVRLERGDTIR